MRPNRLHIFATASVLTIVSAFGLATAASLFDKLEMRYREAPQTRMQFRHIVHSDFFDTADTLNGEITFDKSGRYRTELGVDVYLFDGKCLWEYSSMYNQASKNCVKPGQRIDDSFLFFRNFGEYYNIKELKKDSLYALAIKSDKRGAAPDSLTVILSPAQDRMLALEYYDINKELNRVTIISESFLQAVDSSAFKANFPDSTEIIEIPG